MLLLPNDQILRLHAAVVAIGCDRAALLGGLPAAFVAGLPTASDPKSQSLCDLHELNRVQQLAGRVVPLRVWLETAAQLAGLRVEAAVFREALALLPGESRKLTPSYPDEVTRALSERLDSARERRLALLEARGPTGEVDAEILNLRRQLREGGQLRPGDSLADGRYLLLDRIGRGGFAIVWRALDRNMRKEVAIKVLHGELATDPLRRERFIRGARIMRELSHEAIVRVLNPYGEDGGYHYFVMELLTGGDLRKAILEKRIGGEEVVSVVLKVADALARAHAKGYVHRDVKPANILLDEGGAPRLTDFDLVHGDDTTGGTRTGAMGTMVYAAPEQMQRPQDVQPSADVYSLGMTAVFGLQGQELSLEAVRDAEALIRQRLPDGPGKVPAIKEVLTRAVEWDAAKRYVDAASFAEALRAAAWQSVGTVSRQRYADVDVGDVIAGRYRIVRLLGGSVYAAEHIRTRRQVAVKLFQPRSKAMFAAVERFRRAARAAGAIHSDHVAQVLDEEEDEKHGVVVVFELLAGESLIERLMRTGPMPFEEIHPIMEQMWQGLADVHKADIIHRDLKPSKVFLERRPDGTTRAKILDFDMAKLPKDRGGETITEMGQNLGTFSFMPPEQIGRAKVVDHRADIYATTTMIYQALTGQLPYLARNVLIMVEVKVKKEPRSLSEAIGEPVDPRLEAFIRRGLARNVAERFQQAEEALEEWRALRVLDPPFPRLTRWPPRPPVEVPPPAATRLPPDLERHLAPSAPNRAALPRLEDVPNGVVADDRPAHAKKERDADPSSEEHIILIDDWGEEIKEEVDGGPAGQKSKGGTSG